MGTDLIPELNVPLLRAAVAQIEADPATWRQSTWVHYNCKTSFCLAGWTVVLSGLVDTNGTPTPAGHQFADDHGLMEPYISDRPVGEDGVERPEWEYPYSGAAHILLNLPRKIGFATHPIFGQHAAKPIDFSDSNTACGNHDCCPPGSAMDRQEWAPDSIEELKKTITRETGVVFDEEPADA